VENPLWRNSKWLSKLIAMAIACLAAVWVAVPFLWAVGNSLKTDIDRFRPGAIIPFLQFTPTLDAWKRVIYDPQLLSCFLSSTLVSVGTTLFVLVIGTPAAYSLARFEFRRMKSRDITLWFLSLRVLPPVVVWPSSLQIVEPCLFWTVWSHSKILLVNKKDGSENLPSKRSCENSPPSIQGFALSPRGHRSLILQITSAPQLCVASWSNYPAMPVRRCFEPWVSRDLRQICELPAASSAAIVLL